MDIRFREPLAGAATPERRVEAYSGGPDFESIAARKRRRRELIEDGNVEISGRDLGYCWRWSASDPSPVTQLRIQNGSSC
jgi:hypothetical protein